MKKYYPFGIPGPGADVVWHCRAQRYSYAIDPDADLYGVSAPRLELTWRYVTRRTARCAWTGSDMHRVYAKRCQFKNTEAEAIDQFIARRKRQIAILEGQLSSAKQELKLTEKNALAIEPPY